MADQVPFSSSRLRTAFRRGALRIDAATPGSRDRAVDALRALAILGMILGHWCVTALVAEDGALRTDSPLQYLPRLAPVSWLFQTLAVFFLAGGHGATLSHARARARGLTYAQWLRARLSRLTRPVAALLGLWAVAALSLLLSGAPLDTVHSLLRLALSPLWFLLVLVALTAATPLVRRLHPLWPLAAVLEVDVLRFGLHAGPSWTGWVNVAAGWLVPFTLGAAWARGELAGRRAGLLLLSGGTVATALLVTVAGYPASMVGVPGAAVSNLDPPTLAAVTFGLAQCGLALLLREPLRRLMSRPLVWAGVALANVSAMTLYLWHQTALMVTTSAVLLIGDFPGLHTRPDSAAWVAARLLWLPVFALVLALLWTAFRRCEQRFPHPVAGRRRRGWNRVVRTHRGPKKEAAREVRRV
ncbi:acyltransferase [Streptomyces sp. NPDC046860]|uniref:acyltransferase family protein n=1 Tax=Streptomyces sp. NPDC046860 TaxID=3154495 RepID=UPI0033D58CBC